MNKNKKLEFNIYGTTVKGDYIRTEGDHIVIKTTHDFITEKIGQEQSIHKNHLTENKRPEGRPNELLQVE